MHEVTGASDRDTAPPTRRSSVVARLGGIAPLPVWGLAVLAGALVVLTTLDGAGISWDSAAYVQSGINLAHSNGLVELGGRRMTAFPPGLPVIAAVFEIVGISPRAGLRFIGIAGAALIVLLGWRLLRQVPAPPAFRLVAITFVTVSPILLTVESMLWSETMFIVLTLTFLVAAGRIIERRTYDWTAIVALSLLCWAAFAVRYVGLVLIPTGIVVFLTARWRPTRRDLVDVVAFAALASVGPMAWMLRNRSIDGSTTGARNASVTSIGTIVDSFMATLGRWADSVTSPARPDMTVLGVVMTIAFLGVMAVAVTTAVRRHDTAFGRSVIPVSFFCAAYLAQLLTAQVTTLLDPIDTRLLSPILVPLVVTITAALGVIVPSRAAPTDTGSRSNIRVIAMGLVCLALVSTFAGTLRDIHRGNIRTSDFNTARWRDSELAAATRAAVSGTDTRVMTNGVLGLWVATGQDRIIEMPLAVNWRGEVPTGEVARFLRHVNCSDGPVLAAMYAEGSSTAVPIEDLGSIARFTVIGSFADGTLYRVEPLPNSADRAVCPS